MVKRIGDFLRGQSAEQGAPRFEVLGEEQQALLLLRDYEQSGQGWFWSADAQSRITYISESVAAALGRSRQELLGTPFYSLFTLERQEGDETARTLPLILSANKTFSELAVRAARDDAEIWWAITGRPQFNENKQFIGYRGSGVDATERLRSQRDASRLAMYDSLTGLSNRHRMGQRLRHPRLSTIASVPRCSRGSGEHGQGLGQSVHSPC